MKTVPAILLVMTLVGVAILLLKLLSSSDSKETTLSLEPFGEKTLPECPHCGKPSRRVWGGIKRSGTPRATYFVNWTPGISEHPASFDLIIGEWGTQAPPEMRVGVSLLYRNDQNENSFMVVDAAEQLTSSPELAGRALARSEVVGTPLATEVFELVDFILLQDQRIGPIRTLPPAEK